jgi:hypothetical protein
MAPGRIGFIVDDSLYLTRKYGKDRYHSELSVKERLKGRPRSTFLPHLIKEAYQFFIDSTLDDQLEAPEAMQENRGL